jgi:hypothetical protein
MSSASTTSAKAQQLQQLLLLLGAAPDLAILSSRYCRVKQRRMQRQGSSAELLLLVAAALSNGLQHIQPLLQTQEELPMEALQCINELLALMTRCDHNPLISSTEHLWHRELTQTGEHKPHRQASVFTLPDILKCQQCGSVHRRRICFIIIIIKLPNYAGGSVYHGRVIILQS